MDIPNQNLDQQSYGAASDQVRGAVPISGAVGKGASAASAALGGVAAARIPGGAKVLKGVADQHYKKTGGLSSQVEAPHTMAHRLENYANMPFYIWAGAGIGGGVLGGIGKVPVLGQPFKWLSRPVNAFSGAMNTKLGEIHRTPETFFKHWLLGKPKETLEFDRQYALDQKLGQYGAGGEGRLLNWLERRVDGSQAMSDRFSKNFAEFTEGKNGQIVFGEKGVAGRLADAFGAVMNPLMSPFKGRAAAKTQKGLGAAKGVVARLAHLEKREDILARQLGKKLAADVQTEAKAILAILEGANGKHYFDHAKGAFDLSVGGGVHQVQERIEGLMEMLEGVSGRSVRGAEEVVSKNPTFGVPSIKSTGESVKKTAEGLWQRAGNLVKPTAERQKIRAAHNVNRDLAQVEKVLGKSIASYERASLLGNMREAPGKAMKALGDMSLHEASIYGMIGFGGVAKVQDHMFHRKHRKDMQQQLRSDMGAAGIDPYNSNVAKLANSAASKKGWIDLGTTVSQFGVDAMMLGMMGGHGKDTAKAAGEAVAKMPRMKGKAGLMMGAMAVPMAAMMAANQLKNAQAPALESYTDMKAAETAGEQPPVEAYAQLLSAFSPKLAEYGMQSKLVSTLAEQYHAEGKSAIEVLKEVDKQMPLDVRVADIEKSFVARDVAAAHAAKAKHEAQKDTAVAAVHGGEEVRRAEAVKPSEANENAPESFVARIEAERGNKPLTRKPMVSAMATAPIANVNAAPAANINAVPTKIEMADAALEGVVADQACQQQLAQ